MYLDRGVSQIKLRLLDSEGGITIVTLKLNFEDLVYAGLERQGRVDSDRTSISALHKLPPFNIGNSGSFPRDMAGNEVAVAFQLRASGFLGGVSRYRAVHL